MMISKMYFCPQKRKAANAWQAHQQDVFLCTKTLRSRVLGLLKILKRSGLLNPLERSENMACSLPFKVQLSQDMVL
jgi:hypothetical protein